MTDALGPQWRGLYRAVQKHGGFSVNTKGRSPTTGYMVSNIRGEEQTPLSRFQPEHIASYSGRHAEDLSRPGAYHGAWEEGGVVFQDVSRRHAAEKHSEAYVHMVANQQAAMYDVGGHGGTAKNPAYEKSLAGDPTRRHARAMTRMKGENLPGVEQSTAATDVARFFAGPRLEPRTPPRTNVVPLRRPPKAARPSRAVG